VVTITAPTVGREFRAGTSVTFTATAADPQGEVIANTGFVWSSDIDGPLGLGAEVQNALITPGQHTISCAATDSEGNTGTATVAVTVLDNALPVVTIEAPAEEAFFLATDSVTFRGSAVDAEDGPLGAGALRWTANGEAFGTGGTVTTALPLGDYTVVLTATDSFGATNTDTALVHIVNNLPPVCTIRSPDPGDIVISGESVDFIATCVDPDGVGAPANADHRWTSDLQGQLGFGASVTDALVTIGAHVISVCATDTVDPAVIGCARVSVTVRANTPPTATIEAPTAGLTVDACTDVALRCTVDDADGHNVSVRWLDGGVEVGTGRNDTYRPTAAGLRTMTCEATDVLGATATSTTSITVQSPGVTISSPGDGEVFAPGRTITLRGTGCSVTTGQLTGAALAWSEGATALGTGNVVTLAAGLPGGTHTVTLRATDGVDSRSTSTTFFVSTPPTVAITSPGDGVTVTSGVPTAFTGTATDLEDGTALTLLWTDSASGDQGTGTSTSMTLVPGKHVITFTATDSAGQTRSDTVTVFATPAGTPGSFASLFVNRAGIGTVVDVAFGDGGDVWLATANGLMRVADDLSGTQTFTTANSDLPDDDVRDVFVMATGALVVATDGGLAWDCDRDLNCTRTFQDGDAGLQSNQMTSVVELSNGRLVVGTTDRITIIDPVANQGRDIQAGQGGGDRARDNQVRRLAVDDNDDVLVAWGGNQRAASLLEVGDQLQNRDAHVFTTIDQDAGLVSNDVRDVAFAPSGDRWFGTSAGVVRDDGTDFTVFNDGDGLPSNTVRQLAIDVVVIGGAIREVCWVATQAGLGRIDGDIGSVVGLRAIDGLPSVDLRSVAVDSLHRKYVGHATPSGAFRYDGL